ncbi:mitochondrial enolase superfamily member 1-like isoform X2 [Toxorhynchites rutilus septentrionalis]|uniref:mitochondrial enolase superfamily member 1-like isoform X2 n=1 Tax=Toxorhynchites rutilus septentrionalis TaxID=329112 RepID=UPI00247905A4|nr:mitochondrial enolase superfamily member 1-like isoform X2 [Toxorhynchites rutilus septentrionalis]
MALSTRSDECYHITTLEAKDIRWPTSLGAHGSDAMHTDPDYSCVYVTINTEEGIYGNGLTFTLGRGTDIVLLAVNSMKRMVEQRTTESIFQNFALFWRELTSESQLRWIGPEKGVTHLAVAAIINALWDLWGKIRGLPVWKLLTEMEPEELVSTIDFRYITDAITREEAINILKENRAGTRTRMNELMKTGYPAYTTQVGWLGYSDDTIRALCRKYLQAGFTAFKIKVGQNLENDIKRCRLVREEIGWNNTLMVDANQIWDVNEAIEWMKNLKHFKLLWIEEPTSPDDILGHKKIADALNIGVATGEMCCNRVMFKQFIQSQAFEFCQIDSARIGGVNEILAVYLMAKKFNVKVCPHAGGVGLCEMVQHLQLWDYTSVSCTMDKRMIEFVDQQHEQFVHPARIYANACYIPPSAPGYSTELKPEAVSMFEYPVGSEWQRMFAEGIF